ncbi:D-alanyl-D-alanine carboxypeptidase family protein [Halochromatium glycolicum]|jgi:D-alanyl-D-alanine carboxypeptidase (penicillin-binding protein 5/6)|uniref:serine-type D-Ala-D-Ala carboxypeptidase n=1 Tax=Halochromatium glycolicum TaxID=85075 RepID=A0AAJ0XB37_9GAMM|nr:D-alanyl-D-alanine carboxypeptidase family protein [Halochromatium glycolicum]MBK1705963.1 serine-type D-Ala-D-Ala carboxypeptidase [Halochromatium glycolicum]
MRYLLSILLVALLVGAARAETPAPEPPELGAKGYLLVDHDSGAVLAASNPDQRLEPASLTKIMTAYVVFSELAEGNITLDTPVLVSEKAWRTGGSKMFIEVGNQVSVESLLKGMIIQSGNDASVALAEQVAGSETSFAGLMNQHAERLGMDRTHFTNATGLPDPDHYTTPRDIARVTSAMIREFPDYYRWYSEPEFTWHGIQQFNRNRLLGKGAGVDGVKTGHTQGAGYCLVSSAQRDGQRLISVVMGTASDSARVADSLALLNYGFRFFETHRLYPADEPLETVRIWSGDPPSVPVGPARDVAVTIPRGRFDDLAAQLELSRPLTAPVAVGESVGDIVLLLDGEAVKRQPAVALAESVRGGLVRQAVDSVLKLF